MGLWNVQKLKAILPSPEQMITAQENITVCRNVNWYCSYTENELLTIHQNNTQTTDLSKPSFICRHLPSPCVYENTNTLLPRHLQDEHWILSHRLFIRDHNRCGNATEETLRIITQVQT